MKRLTLIILTLAMLTSLTIGARPRIGLVLGGGGAKGAAEVGALKVIERAGIPVDYIVGTSIGAIVGSLYAAGYSAAELDSLFCQQEWLALLTDRNMELSGEPFKQVKGVTYIFGFPVLDQNSPSWGVLRGGRVEQVIDSMLAAKNAVEFETMRIPFRCVAAEMKTAQEVVLSSGTVPQAVRASMAIPGLFKMVDIDGRKLIDGGMMNNLPVDVARDMGADIVIAIDLQQAKHATRQEMNDNPVVGFADLFGLGSLANWVISRPDIRKYNENRVSADIYINPPLPDYEASSFGNEAMRRMITIGEQAAEVVWDKLMELKQNTNN
ncbi:MAG: patatin-like phospholipase family protein [Prevotella sp.]|nr:patatin-like phospholipase family protein [Prevotella sp.]